MNCRSILQRDQREQNTNCLKTCNVHARAARSFYLVLVCAAQRLTNVNWVGLYL